MSCLIFNNNMELIKEEGSSLPVQSNLSLFDDRLVRFLNSPATRGNPAGQRVATLIKYYKPRGQ